MKLNLIFENSNDSIEFDVVYNSDILEYFISKSNADSCNSYSDDGNISLSVDSYLNELHNAVTLTNTVMPLVCDQKFTEHTDLLEYLDQKFLNRQHEQWVLSQQNIVDIDRLRFSQDKTVSQLGWRLHDLYPDEIRQIRLAEAMQKLGFIFPYEEVNMTVHRLESFFSKDIEFKSHSKWQVLDNPFQDTMISNNDVVNFSFGYTYVGRQYYDKWQYFDTDLDCVDHYNYETLEYAFQVNLDRPQTIPYSKEFINWQQKKGVRAIATQIPIANIIDLEKNLKYYRTMLYKNSKANNRATLLLH
jgi:hypothetical protein